MSTATVSTASTSMSRRMWTRKELLANLEIIGDLGPLLPPTLPLPSSKTRSTPSSSNLKRKPEALASEAKRPRKASVSRQHPPRQSDAYSAPRAPLTESAVGYSRRPPVLEPSEEGEVQEDIPSPPPPPPSANHAFSAQRQTIVAKSLPIRRPKQGLFSVAHFDRLHDEHHVLGRKLKYSGDVRFWSTYPPTNKEYRALPDPPPTNPSYLKHGGIIARLELLDALVSFAYALWCKDYGRRIFSSLATIDPFLQWCRSKWTKDLVTDDAERALVGLIFMIDSFINARKAAYLLKHPSQINGAMDGLVTSAQTAVSHVLERSDVKKDGTEGWRNPQMLPSPASVAPTDSASSTPDNRGHGTPSAVAVPAVTSKTSAPDMSGAPGRTRIVPPQYYSPNGSLPEAVEAAASKVTVPISSQLVGPLKDITAGLTASRRAAVEAQKHLSLPVMARHFPRTFARMSYSTLSADDEHEPTFDDEDGELYWPGQSTTGEGLGWVCLMGQAMIKEFGKQYGYMGVHGVVPKPDQASESPFSHPSSLPSAGGRSLPPRPSTQVRR